MTKEAILSSKNEYTIFKYGEHVIHFRSPYSLEKYTQIKEWNNGYAFTKDKEYIRILNLNNPEMAIVLDENYEVCETSMSDIEIQIVKDYLSNNIEFMED